MLQYLVTSQGGTQALYTLVYTKLGEILDSLLTNKICRIIILTAVLIVDVNSFTVWNEALTF
jgi:hypothetical protein